MLRKVMQFLDGGRYVAVVVDYVSCDVMGNST
jgi:hypothetical protein